MSLSYKFIASPIGTLKLVASNDGLLAILWENDNDGPRNYFPEGLSPGTRRLVARRRTAYDLQTRHFRGHCPFCIGLFNYEQQCAESDTLLVPGHWPQK